MINKVSRSKDDQLNSNKNALSSEVIALFYVKHLLMTLNTGKQVNSSKIRETFLAEKTYSRFT